jgi:hypothetical protein
VIANAVQWAVPQVNIVDTCPMVAPLEVLSDKGQQFSKVGVLQTNQDIQ